MKTAIIAIYCICDDSLRCLRCKDDPQVKMTNAEVLATACISAYLFGGCFWKAQQFLLSHGYFPNMLSKSRLNRRLHAFDEDQLMLILSLIGKIFRQQDGGEFVVDSFPVACCQNCRILRCQIVRGKEYHGYSSTKKSYFYGIRVHMIVTGEGMPIQMAFAPGSQADITAFRKMDLDLPKGSTLYADAAYTDYSLEDLFEEQGISLLAARKRNARRQHNREVVYVQKHRRKRIETAFSQITRRFPKHIAAVTWKGFQLKVYLFILVHSLDLALNLG